MLFRKVAIVGVGLIGGSLGAALKSRKLAEEVHGIGYRSCTLAEARQRGCIDDFTIDVAEGVQQADLVIIATPVSLIVEKAREIALSIPKGCIVTDVGSTKKLITDQLDEVFAGKALFVGSHPMAGSEKRGATNASKDLFDGALCILTQTPNTNEAAIEQVLEMWRGVGAITRVMKAADHDRRVALASHVPHVVAAGVVNVQTDDSLECAASGFADATRIAASDPQLWSGICLDNAREILAGIDVLTKELASVRAIIERGDEQALFERLRRASQRRRSWEEAKGKPET
ncbi:MAG: prephenate dehydrogenase/arogenate dehydrogenase family protein [Planctomycetes bacterium]|nr:prephenate dehydrogenase/arogenate dehydrogenase family protein [Planctomycetota bacterium]